MANSDPRFSAESCDLKPCPFCGGKDLTLTVDRANWKIVVCDDCGMQGPCIDLEGDQYLDRWNNRTFSPAQAVQEPVAFRWKYLEDEFWTLAKSSPGEWPDVICEPLYTSQPSPAATVEPKDRPFFECPGCGKDIAETDQPHAEDCPRAHSSAGNGDAGCGVAAITPWADQYNACWDHSKADALKSAALKALNYIENTENEFGVKLSCGDALREALK